MAAYAHDEIVPDSKSVIAKKKQVAEMFNNIAKRYDFMNRFLSIGIDRYWRRKAINELKAHKPKIILDVATGTADVAILSLKLLQPEKIIGIDISEGMLDIGRKKINKRHLGYKIELICEDIETINYNADTFDAITAAFGVRNFENLEKGLAEMLRVLKTGGKVSILEFSKPKGSAFKKVYDFYMQVAASGFGKLIANNKEAYKYLNKSVKAFPDCESFIQIMQKVGFKQTYFKTLSLGICCIYCGSK